MMAVRLARLSLVVLVAVLLLCVFGGLSAAEQPVGYQSGVGHSILASPDGEMPDYVMSVRIYNVTGNSGGNVLFVGPGNTQPDWDDLYFCDIGNSVRYPHWIDWYNSGPNYVVVYYNITDGVPTQGKQINIYYNNPAATNSENPYAVFKLYDNFDGASVNTTTWNDYTAGHTSFANGKLTITANDNNYRYLASKTTVPDGYTTFTRLQTAHTGTTSYSETFQLYVAGSEISAYYSLGPSSSIKQYYQLSSGTSTTNSIVGWTANTYHTHEIIRDKLYSRAIYMVDGANQVTMTSSYPTSNLPIQIVAQNNGASITIDYVYVKRWTPNAPNDGSWGTTYADTLQAVKFTIIKIDIFGLSVGPVYQCETNVYDVNNNLYGSGRTGNDGSSSFMLYKTQRYSIHFSNSSQGIDKTWTGYPTDQEYVVYVYPWEFVWDNTSTGQSDVNTMINTFIVVSANGSSGDITAYYNDTSLTTSAVTMNVYKRLNGTADELLVTQTTMSNSNFNYKFVMPDVSGQDYKVVITATSSKYGTVIRSYPWRFPGPKYPIEGLPAMAYTWIGFIIPTFVALTASYRNLKFAPIIFCASSWIFVMIGWMDQMGPLYELGLAVVTVFSVIFIFKMKQQEGY